MEKTDAELLRLARAGDQAAWAELAKRHLPSVRRFFATKVPADRVDDLVQETFVRLLKAIVAGAVVDSVRAYGLGIARNVLREFVRKAMRDPRVDIDQVSAVDLDPRPSTLLAAEAERVLLLEAMRRLSLAHQIVLELTYWEDMDAPEIAIVLDENVNTVRGRISRARAALREILEKLDREGVPSRASDTELDSFAGRGRHRDDEGGGGEGSDEN